MVMKTFGEIAGAAEANPVGDFGDRAYIRRKHLSCFFQANVADELTYGHAFQLLEASVKLKTADGYGVR